MTNHNADNAAKTNEVTLEKNENGKQPAFGYGYANEQAHQEVTGLTKREYFAAMAMQGLLVNYVSNGLYGNNPSYPMVAEMAVSQADELLNQLNNE